MLAVKNTTGIIFYLIVKEIWGLFWPAQFSENLLARDSNWKNCIKKAY